MGCCLSRQQAATSDSGAIPPHHTSPRPYVSHNPDSAAESSRNITSTSPYRPSTPSSHSHPTPASQSHSHGHGLGHQHHRPQKSLLPNTPLLPLPPNHRCPHPNPLTFPTSTSSTNPSATTPWTRAKLERERRDWWDTRDTGDPGVWAAYRTIVELVRAGEVSEAQAVLDAAGLTCPDGKVWHAVFDERGVEYAVRGGKGGRGFEWVVFEPVGIVEGGKEDEDGWGGGIGDGVDEGRLRSKGKGRAVEDEDVGEGEVMRLRCRLSSTGRDHVVEVRKGEKIAGIMARLSQITGLEDRRHRISYLGRLYAPHETLPTTGDRAWKEGDVITVLVMENP